MQKKEFISFVLELKDRLPIFVKSMENSTIPGKYKFSYSGDVPSDNLHWGLGQTTFAARILYIFGQLEETVKKDIVKYIQSFQKKDGSFNDDYVTKSTFLLRTLLSIKYMNLDFIKNEINKRAETRQAIASLINLEANYNEFTRLNLKCLDVENYFDKLDWTKPWAAGSHINHLIFFTKYSKKLNIDQQNSIYNKIKINLDKFIQKDGFYKSNEIIPNNQKIGGLMKVLMGLSIINVDKYFVKQSFVDFALDDMNIYDACENFNTLYTLYYCTQHLDYRKEEIQDFVLKEASNWLNYYHRDLGGFSFYQGKSGNNYYGSKVSRGLNEPDLHGSAMFSWGILVASKILRLNEKLGLKTPVL